MTSACEFQLNSPNAVYYSGQTVSGTITLTTIRNTKVRHVRIDLLGEGHVFWDESYSTTDANGVRTNHVQHYTSREVYVSNETYVRGEGVLPLGSHTYTFSSSLPTQCPSSFKGTYGRIRYRLSLIVDRPFRGSDIYHTHLTVLETVNLNLYPTFKLPLLAEEIGTLCCWPFCCGKLLYSLQIPFGAYCSGQTVNYTLCIHNQSMADTAGYSLKFIQYLTFTAHSLRHKRCHQRIVLLQQRSYRRCFRQTNTRIEDEFRIPSAPPSNDPNCIIHAQYKLKITVHMSGCHMSTDLAIPILIGTIPLRERTPTEDATTQNPEMAPTI